MTKTRKKQVGHPAVWACALAMFLFGSAGCRATVPAGAISLADNVYVEELEPGLWRHVSHRFYPGVGFFPSNGLVVSVPDGALLIDTAWGNEATAVLLDWVAERVGPPIGLIITHAHDDRMGGIEEAHRRRVPSWGLETTSAKAEQQGWPVPSNSFDDRLALDRFGVEGEVFFPGPGHTTDNVVVWLRSSETLFGGCMVRATSSGIGNLDDAATGEWRHSAQRLVDRYGAARNVVPGHGEPGGPDLLVHTLRLAEGL